MLDRYAEEDGRVIRPERLPLAGHLGRFGQSPEDQQEPGGMPRPITQVPTMTGIVRRLGADRRLMGQASPVRLGRSGDVAQALPGLGQAIPRPGAVGPAVEVLGRQAEQRLAELDRLPVGFERLRRVPRLDEDPADLVQDRRQPAPMLDIEGTVPEHPPAETGGPTEVAERGRRQVKAIFLHRQAVDREGQPMKITGLWGAGLKDRVEPFNGRASEGQCLVRPLVPKWDWSLAGATVCSPGTFRCNTMR